MQIDLILKDKQLTFADGSPTLFLVSHNDDYVLHIDIAEQDRRPAMFAKFIRDKTSIECIIDADGFVLNKTGSRGVPIWALDTRELQVGVISAGYASRALAIPVLSSVEALCDDEIMEPDDPLVVQLIRMVGALEPENGASFLPPATTDDDGKIMQVKNGRWNKQHPELGEETIHFLTNMEIEQLLTE